MSLKNLNHKETYDSNSIGSRPHLDFYVPHLEESIKYDRIASYYSSSSLLVIANSVGKFIERNGCIRLIVNVIIEDRDFQALIKGEKDHEEILENIFLKDINNIGDEIKKDRWSVLSWMVANDYLKIKVGVVSKNIEHSKLGIFYDEFDNIVSFNGSTNESQSGWIDQSNLIDVFNNWTPNIDKYVKSHINTFEKLWNNRGTKTTTYDFPDAAMKGLIKVHKRDPNFQIQDAINKIENDAVDIDIPKSISTSSRELYYYQKRALVSWKNSNFKGLFNMATGSGKTFTAIKGIDYLRKNTNKSTFTIIVCPYNHLILQWHKELKNEGHESSLIYGENKKWKNDLKSIALELDNGFTDHEIIITNYVTYHNSFFVDAIKSNEFETLLICDEVHNAGSLESRKGLTENIKFRLGLSATPERYFDDYGTYILKDYFNAIEKYTYSYSLEDALRAGTLCGYYYHIKEVKLTDLEFNEYESFNQRIARCLSNDDDTNMDQLNNIFIERSKILTNAINKLDELRSILNDLQSSTLDHTLIYTSPQQIDEVCNILNEMGIVYSRFTMDESADERMEIIDRFEKRIFKVLVAIRCLDEGVDIPVVKRAIILASSGNSREYVQRRGRVLRKHKKKDYSEIYDFFVTREISSEIKSVEKKLIKKQFHRIADFCKTSLNKDVVKDKLLDISSKLKVPLPEEIIDA